MLRDKGSPLISNFIFWWQNLALLAQKLASSMMRLASSRMRAVSLVAYRYCRTANAMSPLICNAPFDMDSDGETSSPEVIENSQVNALPKIGHKIQTFYSSPFKVNQLPKIGHKIQTCYYSPFNTSSAGRLLLSKTQGHTDF